MKIKIGISSCPNDTFMFEAMLNKRVETYGLEFELFIGDIEELNHKVINGELDVSKLSYNAFSEVWESYQLLHSGSALGKGNGPILISKHKIYPDEVNDLKIAIPGLNTTANMLLSIAFPNAYNKKEYLFSDIEEAVLSKEVDAGLIIHENRFTYEKKGLKKIIDLGEFWENKTKLPIPLGGIAVKKSIDSTIKKQIENSLRESIKYAYDFPKTIFPFIKMYAQEMEEKVMQNHIDLYVNNYSIDISNEGKEAVTAFLTEVAKLKQTKIPKQIFI